MHPRDGRKKTVFWKQFKILRFGRSYWSDSKGKQSIADVISLWRQNT